MWKLLAVYVRVGFFAYWRWYLFIYQLPRKLVRPFNIPILVPRRANLSYCLKVQTCIAKFKSVRYLFSVHFLCAENEVISWVNFASFIMLLGINSLQNCIGIVHSLLWVMFVFISVWKWSEQLKNTLSLLFSLYFLTPFCGKQWIDKFLIY